ncbi:MAG: hypothetical protein ACE5KQ_02980 [Thermoplasmata archaeon]
MEDLRGEEDPARAARKRLGLVLGIFGLLLLFGSAASLPFVPEAWQLIIVGLIAVGVIDLVVAFLLVR